MAHIHLYGQFDSGSCNTLIGKMDEYDEPQSIGYQIRYRDILRTGDFVECIYNCENCGHGHTALVRDAYAKQIECGECGSQDVVASIIRF